MLDQLKRNWWVLAVRGVAGILFGIGSFVWPTLTLAVFISLFGAYAIVDGGFAIAGSVRHRHAEKSWWLGVLHGILGIVAGVAAWTLPGMTALALLYLIAFWALSTGVIQIVAAVRLRREIEGEWLLGLAGASSVLFGVLLIMRPAAGVLSVIWLVGMFAIVFGVLNISLGFSLRGIGREHLPTGPLPA